jgi:hypothetical protein
MRATWFAHLIRDKQRTHSLSATVLLTQNCSYEMYWLNISGGIGGRYVQDEPLMLLYSLQ